MAKSYEEKLDAAMAAVQRLSKEWAELKGHLMPKTDDATECQLKPFAISVNKTAELIGVSVPTIWTMIRKGQLQVLRFGERTLVSYPSLEKLVQVNLEPLGDVRPSSRTERLARSRAKAKTTPMAAAAQE